MWFCPVMVKIVQIYNFIDKKSQKNTILVCFAHIKKVQNQQKSAKKWHNFGHFETCPMSLKKGFHRVLSA